jgi:hypothetical protein
MQYQKKPRFQNEKFTNGQIISKHVGIKNKIESCRAVHKKDLVGLSENIAPGHYRSQLLK